MKIIQQFLVKLLFLVCVVNLYSQTLPGDITFFNPTYGPGSTIISESVGEVDDTVLFQNAIDGLTVNGGKVIINAGTYRVLEVNLKSNVHLEINSAVTILPYNAIAGVNNALFNADKNTGVENFSVVGVGGKFTVDISSLATTMRIRVVSFNNCTNFKVSNFHIIDGVTEFSSLAFGGNFYTTGTGTARRVSSVRGVPNHGIIEDISMINGHYGYGLIQVQGGNNLLFRDLNCVGGVTLRLETGYELIQYTDAYDFNLIKLENIWARNIECTDGQSALQLSPHTLDQGYFDVSGVIATSCEAAVVWSAGFVANDEQLAANLTPGTFNSASKVRDVTSTFGQKAQLHTSKRLRYMPCALRVERLNGIGIAIDLNVDGESRIGPAIGAVIRPEDNPGHYSLDFPDSEVTAIGYNIDAYYLPPNAIFSDSYDDYEVCDENIDELFFKAPKDYRGTPNPRNPLENATASVDDFNNSKLKIYPNPSNGIFNISLSNNSEEKLVRIVNVLGKEIRSFKVVERQEINLSNLTKGVYFLHIENSVSKKIVLF